ncbi:hypothetical protein A4G99_05395 [Haladaptatus sp. R4]|uniref:PH domain-containing protein n=1 Tax=Haladaptatus sp. R4 TaxID=1679489 RepID=UPI0007B48424|nr:PH domain-containing protein [Haladaptatus sp. R4]KZN25849.1 hypothetical protein A4G99_05395 [Haladaptatus sp. R4]
MESLQKRVRYVWFTKTVGAGLIGGIIAGIIASQSTIIPVWSPIPIVLCMLVVALLVTPIRYRAWRFAVDEDGVTIEHGVLRRRETYVPIDRIQHIDINRGVLEQAAGLASIMIHTAGSRRSNLLLPGLRPQRASKLRSRILSLREENRSDESLSEANDVIRGDTV